MNYFKTYYSSLLKSHIWISYFFCYFEAQFLTKIKPQGCIFSAYFLLFKKNPIIVFVFFLSFLNWMRFNYLCYFRYSKTSCGVSHSVVLPTVKVFFFFSVWIKDSYVFLVFSLFYNSLSKFESNTFQVTYFIVNTINPWVTNYIPLPWTSTLNNEET